MANIGLLMGSSNSMAFQILQFIESYNDSVCVGPGMYAYTWHCMGVSLAVELPYCIFISDLGWPLKQGHHSVSQCSTGEAVSTLNDLWNTEAQWHVIRPWNWSIDVVLMWRLFNLTQLVCRQSVCWGIQSSSGRWLQWWHSIALSKVWFWNTS